MRSVKWHCVRRGSVGADFIQMMLIAPNLLCNAYLGNLMYLTGQNTLASAGTVAARRRDSVCGENSHAVNTMYLVVFPSTLHVTACPISFLSALIKDKRRMKMKQNAFDIIVVGAGIGVWVSPSHWLRKGSRFVS